MSDSRRKLTESDLASCSWILRSDPDNPRHRFGLADAYLEKARESKKQDDPCHPVFDVLSDITGLSIGADDDDDDFLPPSLLQEIDREDVQLLASHASEIDDADLRSRIRDLSWVLNRDHGAGREAVTDYVSSADEFAERGVWIGFFTQLRRAVRLAKSLNIPGLLEPVVAHIESALDTYSLSHQARFLARDLMELHLAMKLGDSDRQSSNAERIACEAESVGEWDRALAYWQTKARLDDRRGEPEAAKLARIAAARSLESQAREEAAKGDPWTGVAASHMIEAMKMYRNAGEGTVADALHKEALVLQQIARREAQSFSVEMDFAGYVDEARAKVGGQDLNSALTTLASIATPPRLSWLRRQTEEEIQAFPFQHWIQEALKDDRGRTIARRATRGNDESSDQRAFRVDMLKNAEFMRGGMVLAHIEPARVQIMLEHQPRIDQFVDLVSVSPFVPNDRVMIFARGLLGGLKGDFLLAIHLLVPQLEHSIRRIFEQHGVLTTALRQEDVQEDRSLGSLLLDDRFQEAGNDIFGEDLYFDLRGVLVERWGANLRNRVAHGLMSDSAFSSVQCCYAWWMTLRLVLWPHLIALQQEPGEPDMFADPESEASDDFDLD